LHQVSSHEEALDLLLDRIHDAGYKVGRGVAVGLDVAASGFSPEISDSGGWKKGADLRPDQVLRDTHRAVSDRLD
jgi:enolase